MKKKWLFAILVTATVGVLVACGQGGAPLNNGIDPYADPAVNPPAEIPAEEQTIAPAFSLSAPDSNGIISMNVSGVDAGTGSASTAAAGELSAEHFTVVEGGAVKGITVERIGEGTTRAAADIMFVLDTTASMGAGLNSVAVSVANFLDHLDSSGLDAQVGAITFGDAYDTKLESGSYGGDSFMDETPPSFDHEERSSFGLSDDFAAFRQYLIGDITDAELDAGNAVNAGQAREGGRDGGDIPENSLGALEYAYDTPDFGWRTGAQKVFIVITDTCSHNDITFAEGFGEAGDSDKWAPSSEDAVVEKLRGNATVHVVAPEDTKNSNGCRNEHTDLVVLTGSAGTGGVYEKWDDDLPAFDLSDLPIAGAVTSGYIVKYRGTVDGEEKSVRLVIDDGGAHRGDITQKVTY